MVSLEKMALNTTHILSKCRSTCNHLTICLPQDLKFEDGPSNGSELVPLPKIPRAFLLFVRLSFSLSLLDVRQRWNLLLVLAWMRNASTWTWLRAHMWTQNGYTNQGLWDKCYCLLSEVVPMGNQRQEGGRPSSNPIEGPLSKIEVTMRSRAHTKGKHQRAR